METDEALLSLTLGVTGSLIASWIVISATARRERERATEKYAGPVGSYTGHAYTEQGTKITIDKPISKASIFYIGENVLRIELHEPNGSTWVGRIAMQSEQYGEVTWHYDKLHGKPVDDNEHRFGFKRLMYLQRPAGKVVYLVGEEGYGKEILIQTR